MLASFFRRALPLILLIPAVSHTLAQDTARSVQEDPYRWRGGLVIGVVLPVISGLDDTLYSVGPGFEFGVQISRLEFFLRGTLSVMEGKIGSGFDRGSRWPDSLPVDVLHGSIMGGYHLRYNDNWVVKPALIASNILLEHINSDNADPEIHHTANRWYGGISLGILHQPFLIRGFTGTEANVSVAWPYRPDERSEFSGPLWRFSLGIALIFFPPVI